MEPSGTALVKLHIFQPVPSASRARQRSLAGTRPFGPLSGGAAGRLLSRALHRGPNRAPGHRGVGAADGICPGGNAALRAPPAAAAGARGPLPGATSCSMTATFDGSPPRHRQLLDHGSESTPKDPVNSRCTRYLLGDRAQQGQRRRHAMGRSRTEHAASRVSRGTVPRRSLTEPKQKARSGASEVSWHPATAGQYRTARG